MPWEKYTKPIPAQRTRSAEPCLIRNKAGLQVNHSLAKVMGLSAGQPNYDVFVDREKGMVGIAAYKTGAFSAKFPANLRGGAWVRAVLFAIADLRDEAAVATERFAPIIPKDTEDNSTKVVAFKVLRK